jgi:hypothetical protein
MGEHRPHRLHRLSSGAVSRSSAPFRLCHSDQQRGEAHLEHRRCPVQHARFAPCPAPRRAREGSSPAKPVRLRRSSPATRRGRAAASPALPGAARAPPCRTPRAPRGFAASVSGSSSNSSTVANRTARSGRSPSSPKRSAAHSHAADPAPGKVLLTAEWIGEPAIHRIERQRVDGEVAPCEVRHQIPVEDDRARPPSVDIRALGAGKSGHLHVTTGHEHRHRPMGDSRRHDAPVTASPRCSGNASVATSQSLGCPPRRRSRTPPPTSQASCPAASSRSRTDLTPAGMTARVRISGRGCIAGETATTRAELEFPGHAHHGVEPEVAARAVEDGPSGQVRDQRQPRAGVGTRRPRRPSLGPRWSRSRRRR